MTQHRFGWPSLALALIASVAAYARAVAAEGSQDPLEMQRARAAWLAARSDKVHYAAQFDLSALPAYEPAQKLSGSIRHWGSNYLADSSLAKCLEDGFRKFQPGITFEDNLKSTFIGMASLYMDRADVAAMGRKATWEETQAFQRVLESQPVEIAMATGSLDIPGWTWALTPVLNKDNPLAKITLEQLDGIFGAQRDGGWKGNEWDPKAARGPENNIRTWGQLGLTGEWADKPIHVYGYTLNYHFPRDFAEKVMGGGYKWNETMREFGNAASADGKTLISAGDLLIRAVADDKYGITYTSLKYLDAKTKTVPLAKTAAGPFLMPTLQTVQSRAYPLTREVYYYTYQRPGREMNPRVKEYLRFVLSREGQACVQGDGKYLPMTAAFAAEQRAKLEAGGKAAKADGG